MLPEHDRSRPANRTASSVNRDEDTTIIPLVDELVRCSRCRHPLHAPESVRLELGPVCRAVAA